MLGPGFQKCDPKLRIIANGDTDVNVVRAERCDALSVVSTYPLGKRQYSMEIIEAAESARSANGVPRSARPKRPPAKGNIKAITSKVSANVFISKYGTGPLPKSLGITESASRGRLSRATVPLSKLSKLAAHPLVRGVSLGQGLRDPRPVQSVGRVSEPGSAVRAVEHGELHRNSKGVLVGIIDVEGFDFAHPDFLVTRKNGNTVHLETRFEAIWDMCAEEDGASPADYGRIITRKQMNKALNANVGAPATQLEPQSQMGDPMQAPAGAPRDHMTKIQRLTDRLEKTSGGRIKCDYLNKSFFDCKI
ncbi:MAG: hypothetical protein NDI90_08185 [Nitrospira sp. BO4]|jgi:hypothetical protein|nr:hypothetical protein [Nitrospira sp. BO4]